MMTLVEPVQQAIRQAALVRTLTHWLHIFWPPCLEISRKQRAQQTRRRRPNWRRSADTKKESYASSLNLLTYFVFVILIRCFLLCIDIKENKKRLKAKCRAEIAFRQHAEKGAEECEHENVHAAADRSTCTRFGIFFERIAARFLYLQQLKKSKQKKMAKQKKVRGKKELNMQILLACFDHRVCRWLHVFLYALKYAKIAKGALNLLLLTC